MSAELRSVTVRVENERWRQTVLAAVDLVAEPGRITALLGGPGAGKTMVALALTGQLPAAARVRGQVLINGSVVGAGQWPRLRGPVVGYVPQDGVRAFDPEQTVGAQLRRHHDSARVEQACAAAYYPREALDLLPHQHSGGQIQRAALAAALLPEPSVLVADGPANSLDAGTAFGVWMSLRRYADAGATVVAVSNEVSLLTRRGIADRLVILHEGRVVAAGSPDELSRSSDPFVRALLAAP
ncbi:ATP-binding cassette domain-containing protein [Nocardia sp. NPDC004068]|uniref:ATP-binding cassette domain-containing protein n=1 Tax=Nocardia sp. NPDC004068 TaxID=3364303 RepID=UPI0036AFCEA0